MNKIKELNNKQKITVILVIAVFIVSLFLLIKNISQVGKINADISSLIIKDNKIILNVNSTKQKIMNKTQEANINIYSNNVELGKDKKISTGDILRYNNTNYEIAILGDTNKDGNITGSDISQIYSKYKGTVTLSEIQALAADVNEDGKITGSDVSYAYSLYKNPPQEIDDNITYTINFDSNGGSSVSSITKTFGSELGTLPTTSKAGHTFDGWYTAATGGSQITSSTKVIANTTYYAHWTAQNCTITFDSNGGSSVSSQTKTCGSIIGTLPSTSKTGNTFNGWYTAATGGSQITVNTIVNSNVTYYAQWTPYTYTITYDSNGGSSVAAQTKSYGSTLAPLPSSSKNCFTFAGWYTNPSSTGTQVTASTTVTANAKYYAHWNSKGNVFEGDYYCENSARITTTGWKQIGGSYYYFVNGVRQKSQWLHIGDGYYYVNSSGVMLTGWQKIEGKDYYFNSSGVMEHDCYRDGYWLGSDGATTGATASWQHDTTGYWYKSNQTTWYATSQWLQIDGSWYYFDASGYCTSGC